MAGWLKEKEDLFSNILDHAKTNSVPTIVSVLEKAKCESPIEEVMLVALYLRGRFLTTLPFVFGYHKPPDDRWNYYPPWTVVLYSQVEIAEYRVDFLLRQTLGEEKSVSLVIECDGHEFHERTKEQAARDRARDRKLQDLGMTVFRFTGSEIWADPTGCAHQAFQALLRKALKEDRGGDE